MKRLAPTLLAFFLISTAGPVSADWQYTKWGMSPAQAIAAGEKRGVEVQPVPASKQAGCSLDGTRCKLRTVHTAGDLSFEAYLQFDPKTDRLIGVNLTLLQADLDKAQFLFDQLIQKYGKPSDSEGPIVDHIWRTSADRITYVVVTLSNKTTAVLDYRALSQNMQDGL